MSNPVDDLGFLFKKITEIMKKGADEELACLGITMAQAQAMMAVSCSESGSLSMKELERFLHVAQPTIVGTVLRLEKKNLVCSEPDPHDKRVKRVRLTENGAQKMQTVKQQMKKRDETLTACLTEEERKEFSVMLKRVYHSLKEQTELDSGHCVK